MGREDPGREALVAGPGRRRLGRGQCRPDEGGRCGRPCPPEEEALRPWRDDHPAGHPRRSGIRPSGLLDGGHRRALLPDGRRVGGVAPVRGAAHRRRGGCRHRALDRRPAAQRPADRADGRRGRPGLLPALPAAQRVVPGRAGRPLLRAGPGRSLAAGHLAAVLLRVARRLDVAVFSFPKWLLGGAGRRDRPADGDEVSPGTESMVRLGTPFLAALARTVEREPGLRPRGRGPLGHARRHAVGTPRRQRRRSSLRRRVRMALLERMRRYALEHLHDPGLGPDQIARAHFVSTRYVHKLFAAAGCGVAAWVREQRLERALGRSAPVERCLGRRRRSPVGIPRPGQLQSRLPADLRLAPRASCAGGPDADPVRGDGARVRDGLLLGKAGLAEAASPRCRTSRAR